MPTAQRSFLAATTLADAMAARRHGAMVLAGGTWMMRDPRRGVDLAPAIVSLHRIAALASIEIGAQGIAIGALVTHAELAVALRGVTGFEGLAAAAQGAANPGVRRVATLGGNLCTPDFPAADLIPACLVCDATVEIETDGGPQHVGMQAFMNDRAGLLAGAILTRVHLRRDIKASAHVRLPLRMAGDYPVAIVSFALDDAGSCRIAVGSVEALARRWTALERAFASEPGGLPADAERAGALAIEHNDFQGRDGTDAQGWYRSQVLAPLVKRGVASLLAARVVA